MIHVGDPQCGDILVQAQAASAQTTFRKPQAPGRSFKIFQTNASDKFKQRRDPMAMLESLLFKCYNADAEQ